MSADRLPTGELRTEQWNRDIPPLETLSTLDMLRVINEQDFQVALAVQHALPDIARAVDVVTAAVSQGGRVFYIGAGTSGRLAALDAAECPPTFGVPASMFEALVAGGEEALTHAREHAEDDVDAGATALEERGCTARDVVVGLAASGRTPYVLGALRWARAHGVPTIGVTSNPGSPLKSVADPCIVADTGPEPIMGSTRMKAGTAEKLILNMLSTGSMVKIGKTYRNLMVDMKTTNAKLHNRARRIVMLALDLSESEATRLLDQAGGSVKEAIALGALQRPLPEVQRLLDEYRGSLAALFAGTAASGSDA